jgi:hypothetical protein
LKDYDKGRIGALFEQIKLCPQPVNLERELKFHKPRGGMERELLELFRAGMLLLTGECIMDHEYFYYNPYLEWGENDVEIIDMNRSILFTYKNEDFMTDRIMETLNNGIQWYGDEVLTPVTCVILRPDTGRVFRPSDYSERFSRWCSAAFDIFCKYE